MSKEFSARDHLHCSEDGPSLRVGNVGGFGPWLLRLLVLAAGTARAAFPEMSVLDKRFNLVLESPTIFGRMAGVSMVVAEDWWAPLSLILALLAFVGAVSVFSCDSRTRGGGWC